MCGEEILIVDSRPIGEFRNMSIPGAFDCPGAELVYRVPDRLRSPDSLVVVNCAGRTRSIIGAQSLRNAGLANPVMALENGTMGWELAGLELARGREDALPPPSPEGLAQARALADEVAERFGIRRIDDAALARFESEAGAAHALCLRRAQPRGIRGRASRQRALGAGRPARAGHRCLHGDAQRPHRAGRRRRRARGDDRVVAGADGLARGLCARRRACGPQLVPGQRVPAIPELDEADVATIDAAELKRLLDAGRGGGGRSRAEHRLRGRAYPGRLVRGAGAAAGQPRQSCRAARCWCLTSPDAALARLAAAELGDCGFPAVYVLDGGTEAWRDAGLPLATGREAMADTPDDCWRRPYDPYAREGARERYLKWEIELVHQIEREGDVGFAFPG